MAVGKRIKWGQLLGAAVLAGAAMSAQAASSQAAARSQGSANAAANGQSHASGSSVLNGGTATVGKTSKDDDKAGGNLSAASTGTTSTSTGTVVTSVGTASGAAVPSTLPGGITYGVDGYNHLAAANAFYGLVSGNDNAGINGLGTPWGGGWTLAAKDNTDSGDDVANRVLGIGFSVDAGAKAGAGYWALSGSGLRTGSIFLDVVAVLKSSTQYGLYYFQNVVFDGAVGGEWLSPSFNARGERQDLSHLSIYVRTGSEPTLAQPAGFPANSAGGGMAAPRAAVAEPGTLALFSAALLALAVIRRKAVKRG